MLGLAAGCQNDAGPNVVIVTFDTTRADHLGPYHPAATWTPAIDQLAKSGVVFEHAVAPAPITLPSHSSIMTGKMPFAHGVRDNGLFKLHAEHWTLAEVLSERGYRTAAAVGSFPLTEQFGIGQGFDFFDDHVTSAFEDTHGRRVFPKQRLFFDERNAGRVNEAVLPWLKTNADEPFFLWVHYFDPHHPHEPPPPYGESFLHNPYAGEIAYADESLGVIVDTLKKLDVYDNTMIIVTSDHGEGNGEHSEETHSMLVYESTQHVPWIMKSPGIDGGLRLNHTVSTTDIFPTVLDALSIPIPNDIQGESQWPVLISPATGALTGRLVYTETLSPQLTRNWGALRGLYLNGYKYIHGPRPEMFDLDADPKELNNIIDLEPERAVQLKAMLQGYIDANSQASANASVNVDQQTLERLQGLGYVHFSRSGNTAPENQLVDGGEAPQDHVGEISLYSLTKNLIFQDELIKAQENLHRLLRGAPDNPHYTMLLAQTNLGLERYAEAAQLLDSLPADSEYPSQQEILSLQSEVALRSGNFELALEKLHSAQSVAPSAQGQYSLSKLYEMVGRTQQQEQSLERALVLDPKMVVALVDMAVLLATNGQEKKAGILFETAIVEQPYYDRIRYNYGVFLLQIGNTSGALEQFRKAVELNPMYLQAHYALIETFWNNQHADDARMALQELGSIAHGSVQHQKAMMLINGESL